MANGFEAGTFCLSHLPHSEYNPEKKIALVM
jgi:hypothetical protein